MGSLCCCCGDKKQDKDNHGDVVSSDSTNVNNYQSPPDIPAEPDRYAKFADLKRELRDLNHVIAHEKSSFKDIGNLEETKKFFQGKAQDVTLLRIKPMTWYNGLDSKDK